MRKLLIPIVCFLALNVGSASTWYVDSSVPASGDGESWETAFQAIQEGIDAASSGDTVTVAKGLYVENIHFNGKNIVLTSTDPLDSDVIASTIIDGNQSGSVVTFSGAEPETCVLSGFTIRNGRATVGGGIYSETANDRHTRATIRHNVITGNWAEYGGGVASCDGVIANNVVSENEAEHAGGLGSCDGTVENNTICYNRISRASAVSGLYDCDGTIRNCIIWGSTPWNSPQLGGSADPMYCCIQNWRGDGEGVIFYNPHFVDPQVADYHLQTWSPCIDAGDPTSSSSEEPQFNGGRINMGAFGNTPEATSASQDSDSDLLPDDWELHFFGVLTYGASEDTDGYGGSNLEEYRYGTNPAYSVMWYVDRVVKRSGNGQSWAAAFKTIREGIEVAGEGDVVNVAEGTYLENIELRGKNITLTSTDPLNPDVVASTAIDGGSRYSVVTFEGTEDEICILSGFTITNGDSGNGGGIRGTTARGDTHATIQNNVIAFNEGYRGGGISEVAGTIRNNIIHSNIADSGGGLSACSGLITRNLITSNVASQGGGLNDCRGTVCDNRIIDNKAGYAGGICGGYGGIIRNNLIAGNVAGTGGGIGYPAATIVNNTIVRNISLSVGGGVRGTSLDPTIYNCIIWGNEAPSEPQFSLSPPGRGEVTHCCIQDWTGGGEGNIADDPRFVDLRGGDYRLLSSSPCIDAGDNSVWGLPETDMSGMHRIMYGGKSLTVDMGAYEFHIWPPSLDSPMGEVVLKWSSLTGKTYSVHRSSDMLTWELAGDSIPSMGDTFTTWGDPTTLFPFPEVRLRFYRIIEDE